MAEEKIINRMRAGSGVDWHKDEAELFTLASARLCNQIMKEGKNLGHGILKVNGFINHKSLEALEDASPVFSSSCHYLQYMQQVDVALMDLCGHALAQRFADSGATVVLTAQTSGVLPAQACARYLQVPMIFARESRPVTMGDGVYEAKSRSHTKGADVSLFVASEFLTRADKILIVDDFLASGTTAVALLDIVRSANATPIGFAFLIEKSFEGGRRALNDCFTGGEKRPPVAALAYVSSLEETGEIRLSGFRV